jgi:hypothetical protein
MPELAPIETRPPAGSCPTAEELACYIDGTLTPEEAARVTEHLTSCESCFEVYSEVLQFQLEPGPRAERENIVSLPASGRQKAAEKVAPFPTAWRQKKRRAEWATVSSLAALLLIGLGFGVYSYLLAPPSGLITAEVTGPFQTRAAALSEKLWMGPRSRGGGDQEEQQLREASFEVGVQLVNLQISLEANGVKNSQDAVSGIYRALKTQPFTDDLQTSYKELTGAIESAKSPRNLLPKASQLAKESRDYLDPLFLDLGQWVAAGWLAADSQDPAFFRLSESQSFLRRVLWRDRLGFKDSKLPENNRKELDAISEILAKGDLQPDDYATLKTHFDNILKANYPD